MARTKKFPHLQASHYLFLASSILILSGILILKYSGDITFFALARVLFAAGILFLTLDH
ncbi:MAG: hypothetical protein AAB682_03445 [Patescibacteria group bacterium]